MNRGIYGRIHKEFSSQKEIIFLRSVEGEMTLRSGQVVPKQFFHLLCFLWHNRGECRVLKTCICFSDTFQPLPRSILSEHGRNTWGIGRVKSLCRSNFIVRFEKSLERIGGPLTPHGWVYFACADQLNCTPFFIVLLFGVFPCPQILHYQPRITWGWIQHCF